MSNTQVVENLNAKEFANFLSQEETSLILNFAKNTDLWINGGNDFWDGRVINASVIHSVDKALGEKLFLIKNRIIQTVKDHYKFDSDIYADLLQVTRWFPGMNQPPHSDNMENTDHHPIHKHREYGIVIYLNDDFSGGRTFYPQHNFEIVPKPGKMAVHPATTDHLHGVTTIEGNIRYTLTSFLTFDKSKDLFGFIG